MLLKLMNYKRLPNPAKVTIRKSEYLNMAALGSSLILLQYRSVKIGVQEKCYYSALFLEKC